MKRNKGFTLIELLAVIVILAIIALIAVPVILNIIDKANKSAFKDTAYGILSAGELYFAEQQLEVNGMTEKEVKFILPADQNTLGLKGDIPEGSITITRDGDISLMIKNSRYCVTKGLEEDDITITEESDDCEIPSGEAGGQVEKKTDLQDYSWSEIQTLAQDDGANLAEYGIQIGDTITYEGKTYYLVSDERNGAYGGLVFMYNSGFTHAMNAPSEGFDYGDNNGGYANSEMHTYLNDINGEVYQALPDELKSAIKTVNTISCNDGYYENDNKDTANGTNQTISATLFLPSVREVSGSKSYTGVEGETFDYFTDPATERGNRKNINNSSFWWLRSADGGNSGLFWYVNSNGNSGISDANRSGAVVPAFVIG